jgi:branched-chain amino acid transport system permease protein
VSGTAATTIGALGQAARDARAGWTRGAWAGTAAVAVAALVPLAVADEVRLARATEWLAFAVAALGLAVAVGVGAMPSLAQGAFVATGAFVAAQLQSEAGWPFLVAAPAAVAVTGLAGAVVGAGLVRLRGAFIAAGTWLVAWLAAAALSGFPWLSGGTAGITLDSPHVAGRDVPSWLEYELVLGLVGLAAVAVTLYVRGLPGIALAAIGARPETAAALGLPSVRLRLGAFTLAAAAGGLAGCVDVQVAGIADPSAYGPRLSFELLGAVVLGGAATALGPLAGTALIALAGVAAGLLTAAGTLEPERLAPVATAILVFAALSLGRPLLAARRVPSPVAPRTPPFAVREPAVMRAAAITKRYGELVALDGFDLELRGGEVCALVGPNGSGKTTALRLLAGTVPADAGSVELDGRDITSFGVAERVRAGVVRTLQTGGVVGELTVLEHAVAANLVHRRDAGLVRTIVSTPRARTAAAAARGEAAVALREVGLLDRAERPAAVLDAVDRRLLLLAAALATRPSVLLIDELAAGAARGDLDRLVDVVERLREAGVAVLLVEHDFGLLRRVADRVVVLEAGRIVAAGSPEAVAADPAVRAVYLGRRA